MSKGKLEKTSRGNQSPPKSVEPKKKIVFKIV